KQRLLARVPTGRGAGRLDREQRRVQRERAAAHARRLAVQPAEQLVQGGGGARRRRRRPATLAQPLQGDVALALRRRQPRSWLERRRPQLGAGEGGEQRRRVALVVFDAEHDEGEGLLAGGGSQLWGIGSRQQLL